MPSDAVMDRIKNTNWRTTMADPTSAIFAGEVSVGLVSVIFVQQELSKDANGNSNFSLPKILPYPTPYFTSVGNATPASGYRTVMRVFNSSMGYAKLRIQHSFSSSEDGKRYVFATTELCVLDMAIGKEFKGYATKIEGKGKKRPPVTTAYSALGLHLTKDHLDAIDMSDVPAYEATITMKDTRHATDQQVIEKMARDNVEGFREVVDVVNSVFSQRRKPMKMSFFVPAFNQQSLSALSTLQEAVRRSTISPYLPLCVKVPNIEKFMHPNQMVSHQEVGANLQQESAEVYYQTMLEMVVRLSYGCRSEHFNAEAVAEWLKDRPQKGIRIPLPFLQIEGQVAAGLIILPALQDMEAMPAVGEVVKIKVDVEFTMQTPPEPRVSVEEKCGMLGKKIRRIILLARDLGNGYYSTVAQTRVGLDLIAIPAQTEEEADKRQKWLFSFAKQCMPQMVDEVLESPDAQRKRLQSLVEANHRFFHLREPTPDEVPMLTAVRVAPPPFLQAYGPHCYFTIDAKQPNWPNYGPAAPLVQFAWPNVPLESTVEAALKTKTFNLWLHRTCHDETLRTQIRGIHDFAPDPVDNTEFSRFARWCLDFGETSEKHDPAEFWPALKHLRNRIDGKKFEECAYAYIPQPKPKPKPTPSQTASKQPVFDRNGALVINLDDFCDYFLKPEDLEIDDIVDGDPPKINRLLSELLVKAFHHLDEDQKKVVMATELSHGVLLVSGCPGSGKSLVGLFMAILSILTTVDVSRFPANISSPTPQVGQVGFKDGMAAISADTHDQLTTMADKIDEMGKDMFQTEFMIVYVTNPNMTPSVVNDLLGGKKDVFDDIERPELDSTTVEYMLYEAGNEFRKSTHCEIRGHRHNIAWHIRNIIESVRQGTMTFPVAQDISDFMNERNRDPIKFANDKERVKRLKQSFRELEMLIYNTADFIVGTPVALGRLSRNKAFTGTITCLMIDDAYRMNEANMLSLFAAFKNTPIRQLVGDMRQMGPVVTTLRTDNKPKSELDFTNPFAMQLSQAMPARMEAAGFVPYSLNVNHRDPPRQQP
ncbi:hypothetical protein PG984_016442 [Apiospora sp. TS-2023a]